MLQPDEPESAPTTAEPVPEPQPQPVVETVQPEEPAQSTGVRRSTRVKFQTREPYVPSFSGSRYSVAVAQLENHGALHPDLHLAFFQHMQEKQPDVVDAILTRLLFQQLTMKKGLKDWGEPAEDAVFGEMKQLHYVTLSTPNIIMN